jgi:hypothetical protein
MRPQSTTKFAAGTFAARGGQHGDQGGDLILRATLGPRKLDRSDRNASVRPANPRGAAMSTVVVA